MLRHANAFGWARPSAPASPRYGAGDLACDCARLAETGVLLLPGSVYDQPDHLRIGFGRADMPDTFDLLEPTSPARR